MAKKAAAACAAIVLVLGGYAAADTADLVPGVLTTKPPREAPAPFPEAPNLALDKTGAVLPDASADAGDAQPDGVASTVDPLLKDKALGKSVGVDIRDGLTGDELYSKAADEGHLPASTTKVLTAAAALTTLGSDRQLTTRVVAGPGSDEITVVGGGDMLLGRGDSDSAAVNGRAGLASLAKATADALREAGTTEVAVRLDDTLYSGKDVSDEWAANDVANGEVAPISPLMVDSGKEKPGQRTPRASAPADFAAGIFVEQLKKNGIKAVGKVARSAAQSDAEQLAEVKSASIGDIVEYMLLHSDNVVAEGLGRLVAVDTGRSGSFLDAADAVQSQVKEIGVDVAGVSLHDVSGLAHSNRITAQALTGLLTVAAQQKTPELDSLIPSLPVAGFSGTLTDRYGDSASKYGAGLVRAKTGSLTGVSTLAGVVTDKSGRLLVFAVLADDVPKGGNDSARKAIDAVTAALAGCGCGSG
ncbi:D-alanyl-D-alanine carboxypeptidase/D-alanyl-D-alanine-endopeptidase [Saxibacter everestensis]|uniref:D-alanyl-D-alanine carboxypeptidase/D-alanyl-D-alanine-endopeptidase n=1 Tax=Saxibacter everestensis TaxID=2909229 RepID=A0ABY8QRQ9_9MICO|nr:D-alanyl-D-alanine carboxypeptidase/D-alanyl-D-alanine-endopeptidase [Brevibacteriaceae bacterium ZFBP1038]